MFSIKATKRDKNEKIDDIRAKGEIPAVYYGAKQKESVSISVPLNEFKKVWRDAGESSAVKLSLGVGQDLDVLIHEVQTHPVKDEPLHVDFLVLDMTKKIEVSIPLEFVGISPAVKGGLGSLVKVMHEVDVEALPKDLPQVIEVDLSSLVDTESLILVSNIKLPTGVEMITGGEEVVASIAIQQEETEDSTPVDLSSIEVEKKGKKEEDASAGEA